MKSTLAGIVLSIALAGCFVHGHAAVQYNEPPPPREEIVVYRPGFFWIHGHWMRDGQGEWSWQPGYYERERGGYVYGEGHWERHGSQYVWVEGSWRRRGGLVIRE